MENKEGSTLFWKDDKDFFIVSSTLDRLGDPEYLFCIYYVKNLEKCWPRKKPKDFPSKKRSAKAENPLFRIILEMAHPKIIVFTAG